MKRILKYISYTLMYLVISIASAYGVILISWNGASNTEDSVSTAQMPEQLSNIVYNVMQKDAIDFDLSVSCISPTSSIQINADCYLDISNGFENLTLLSQIEAQVNEEILNFDVSYFDNGLYVDAFNNKFYIDTNNMLKSITQILQNVGADIPTFDIDLNSLDINQILNLFSNLKETILEESRIIEIELPVIKKITIETDHDYNLISFKVPTLSLENYSISVEGKFNMASQGQTVNKNPEQYKDLTILLDVANKFITYANENDVISLNGNLTIKGNDEESKLNNFNLFIDKNLNSISLCVDDYLNVTLKNNKIFFNFFNVYLQFDLSKLPNLIEMLKENFNINLPLDFLNNIDYNNIDNIINQLPINSFKLSDLDLSIIEQMKKVENDYYISIRDLGIFTIASTDNAITSVDFDSDLASVNFKLQENQVMPEINEEKYKYCELSSLLPYIEKFANLFKSNAICGTMSLTVSTSKLIGQYQIILNNNSPEFYVTLNDGQIKLAFYGTKIYVQLDTISFLLDINDEDTKTTLEALQVMMNEYFDINISLPNILNLILSQLHYEVNESLITNITAKSNSLDIETGSNMLIKLSENENGLNIFATDYNDASLSLKLEMQSSIDTTLLFEIEENKALNSSSLNLGIAILAIVISANSSSTIDQSMQLFGFDAHIHFEFNNDKTIKTSELSLKQGDINIVIAKTETESSISFMGLKISTNQTSELKQKGEEIYNKLPFKI